jgi:hypothetical protein
LPGNRTNYDQKHSQLVRAKQYFVSSFSPALSSRPVEMSSIAPYRHHAVTIEVRRNRQPPVECAGQEVMAQGHDLSLKHSIGRSNFKAMNQEENHEHGSRQQQAGAFNQNGIFDRDDSR